jgi:glycosyltransferase involved in cell wall biosynthesis
MITVITLTFNNYDELIKTCDSISGVVGIEHLIINGGKCEKTLAFLKNYSGRSISESDHGISDAFNKGVKYCNTEYFCYLNSGDILINKEYFAWANSLIQVKNIEFLHTLVEIDHPIYGRLTLKPAFRMPLMPFCHQGMIMKKSTFLDLGQFSMEFRIAMDYDLLARAYVKNLLTKNELYDQKTILIDGHGISSTQELNGIDERQKSIRSLDIPNITKYLMLNELNFMKAKYHVKMALDKIGAKSFFKYMVRQ